MEYGLVKGAKEKDFEHPGRISLSRKQIKVGIGRVQSITRLELRQ